MNTKDDCISSVGTVDAVRPSELAATGLSSELVFVGVLGLLLLVCGAPVLVTRNRRRAAHRIALGAGAIALLAGAVLVPTLGASPAAATELVPGLPAHCYEDPELDVAKGDPGNDTHEVVAGEHPVVTSLTNKSAEALSAFTFEDVTESGQPVVWATADLDALRHLTLQPGAQFELHGMVRVAAGETHRDSVTVAASGAVSGKPVTASDATTLVAPPNPDPDPVQEITAAEPAVVRQCDVEPQVTFADSEGVEYRTERIDDRLIVTAHAKPGYEFAQGQQTEWSIDMTYETSVWDDAGWPVADPVGWANFAAVQGEVYFGRLNAIYGTIPLTVAEVNSLEELEAYSTNWFAEVQEAGATLAIGDARVETRHTEYWAAPVVRSARYASRSLLTGGCKTERTRPECGSRARNADDHGCTRASNH